MLEQPDVAFHQRVYERLRAALQQLFEQPEAPSGAAALNDLLIRIRLKGWSHHLR